MQGGSSRFRDPEIPPVPRVPSHLYASAAPQPAYSPIAWRRNIGEMGDYKHHNNSYTHHDPAATADDDEEDDDEDEWTSRVSYHSSSYSSSSSGSRSSSTRPLVSSSDGSHSNSTNTHTNTSSSSTTMGGSRRKSASASASGKASTSIRDRNRRSSLSTVRYAWQPEVAVRQSIKVVRNPAYTPTAGNSVVDDDDNNNLDVDADVVEAPRSFRHQSRSRRGASAHATREPQPPATALRVPRSLRSQRSERRPRREGGYGGPSMNMADGSEAGTSTKGLRRETSNFSRKISRTRVS
ncbi:hypothetical protein GGR56DRAFT_654698 [Xylariaceae sp. FL0804]|nr:hypothetical protein GGR56DRAFT_654698 [Xylariaceae sp. FL0804]